MKLHNYEFADEDNRLFKLTYLDGKPMKGIKVISKRGNIIILDVLYKKPQRRDVNTPQPDKIEAPAGNRKRDLAP